MIDVNKITSTLAKLPDPQLQQYAQMHKNDPYIMALAMSESNRRKEMRAAAQGGQGMQEQPKVVDQMLAEMAPQRMPEDQGIGQLPAGEMNFAGGGIVAFADGGDVERYQDRGLVYETPYDRMNRLRREEAARRAEQGDAPLDEQAMRDRAFLSNMFSSVRRGSETLGRAAADVGTIIPRSLARAYDTVAVRPMRAAGINAAYLAPKLTPEGASAGSATPFTDLATARSAAEQDIAARDRDSLSEQQAAAVVAAAQPATAPRAPAAPPSAPRADTRPAGPRPGAPAAGPAGAAPSNQFDVSAMMRAELDKQRAAPDPLEADRAALAADRKALAESKVTGLEAIHKNFDNNVIFAGRKARMDTREGEIGRMKDQTLGLALLNAGATMMSTRGNLGTAIGAGIGVGSKQYVDGMGRIEAAKEKLSTARDRLEELEAQRGELSARELFEANQDVKQVGISVKDDMIKARMAFNNESYAKAEKAVTAQLNANLEVYKQQQANVRTDKTVAGMTARAGDPANKQLELQIKVQNLLQNNPLYKAAASRAQFKGPMGEAARSAMQNIERDTYAKFAPELLQLQQQSGLGTMTPPPGAGSAGGARPPIDSFQR
jgi:hypothetical protein